MQIFHILKVKLHILNVEGQKKGTYPQNTYPDFYMQC